MKKILTFLIILVFVMSQLTLAKAYDISMLSKVKLIREYNKDTTFDKMDSVYFGSYPQSDIYGNVKEPIEWFVLERQGSKTLLWSKYILDTKPYHTANDDKSWKQSVLRNWLNSTFLNTAFSVDEQKLIVTTYLINYNNSNEYDNSDNNTYDKIFCMSQGNELCKYVPYRNSTTDWKRLVTKKTNFAKILSDKEDYWMRSLCDDDRDDFCAPVSTNDGYLERSRFSEDNIHGVRPALWVSNLSSSSIQNNSGSDTTLNYKPNIGVGTIAGMPSRQSEWKSDSHFYLDDSMQRNKWVYYVTDYYHVDANGDIEKNKWIEQRYVGNDGKMYRGRQTPDGQYVGDNGYVVNVVQDLFNSVMIKTADPDSWYQTQSGLWYYFENDRTTTKKGWFKDYRDDQWYYFDLITGIMQVGWQKIDGKDYYFNEFHTGNNWYEVGGGFFESYGKKVKAYGSMFKSEKTPDGYWVNWNGEYIKNGNFFLAINPITYLWIILVVLIIIIVAYYLRKKNFKINDIIVVVINKFNLLIKNKPKKSK